MNCGRSVLTAVAAACAVGSAGCGGAPSTEPGSSFASLAATASPSGSALGADSEAGGPTELERDDAEPGAGVGGTPACALLPVARVRALAGIGALSTHGQDSPGLSSCRYGRGDDNVRVLIDGTARATRRFFDMQTEALEFRAQGKGPPVTLINGLGDDTTYGNAGAYWFPNREAVTTFRDRRIIRVIIHLPHHSSAQLLAIGKAVTRRVSAGLAAG